MTDLRHLAAGLTTLTIGLAGCGGDAEKEAPAKAEPDRQSILIKTRVHIPTGEVLPASRIGESPFCPDGTFRDRHGDQSAGEGLVVKEFRCPGGRLTITFSPTQRSYDQSSAWSVIGGTGRYAEMSGEGKMEAHFNRGPTGRETFTGTVVG